MKPSHSASLIHHLLRASGFPRRTRLEAELRSHRPLSVPSRIRPASAADLRFLCACWAHIAPVGNGARLATLPTASPYLRAWMRPNDFGFIASKDGKDVGAIWARQFPTEHTHALPELVLAVLPEYRDQGIGQQLLNALALEARQRNHKGLVVQAPALSPALRLLARVGFRDAQANQPDWPLGQRCLRLPL